MMEDMRRPVWESLFVEGMSIIDKAQFSVGFEIAWSFGGGTALMLQIDHRDSFDIDIFVDDPQLLPFLNPKTQGYELGTVPDDYQTDGIRALKLVFTQLGEIDFICAAQLTENPTTLHHVLGLAVQLETPAEIIAKKIFYRGRSLQPRDMFDIACVARSLGDDYVRDALQPFRDKAIAALAVSKAMDRDFAKAIMQNLVRRPAFANMPDEAHGMTVDLLEAVCAAR